jgi:hypothetical protein
VNSNRLAKSIKRYTQRFKDIYGATKSVLTTTDEPEPCARIGKDAIQSARISIATSDETLDITTDYSYQLNISRHEVAIG